MAAVRDVEITDAACDVIGRLHISHWRHCHNNWRTIESSLLLGVAWRDATAPVCSRRLALI